MDVDKYADEDGDDWPYDAEERNCRKLVDELDSQENDSPHTDQ